MRPGDIVGKRLMGRVRTTRGREEVSADPTKTISRLERRDELRH